MAKVRISRKIKKLEKKGGKILDDTIDDYIAYSVAILMIESVDEEIIEKIFNGKNGFDMENLNDSYSWFGKKKEDEEKKYRKVLDKYFSSRK